MDYKDIKYTDLIYKQPAKGKTRECMELCYEENRKGILTVMVVKSEIIANDIFRRAKIFNKPIPRPYSFRKLMDMVKKTPTLINAEQLIFDNLEEMLIEYIQKPIKAISLTDMKSFIEEKTNKTKKGDL